MSGWKTRLAAGLSILYGLLGWALGLHEMDTAMQFVVNGLGLAGIGHKIEKTSPLSIVVMGSPAAEEMTDEAFTEFVRKHQK